MMCKMCITTGRYPKRRKRSGLRHNIEYKQTPSDDGEIRHQGVCALLSPVLSWISDACSEWLLLLKIGDCSLRIH